MTLRRKFLNCSSKDLALIAVVFSLAYITWVLLRFFLFQRVEWFLSGSARRLRRCLFFCHFSCDRIVWAVAVLGRHAEFARNCLIQALVVQFLMALCGQRSQLCMGVAKDTAGLLEAHAWIESSGKILIGGSGLERFTPLLGLQESIQ